MKSVLHWIVIGISVCVYSVAGAELSVANPIDKIVAVVNEDVITALELESEVRDIKNELLRQKTRLPSDAVLQKQILDRMILQQLQLQTAERVHIRVDDEMLNRTLNNIATQNRLSSLESLKNAVESDGMDFNRFRETIRKQLIIQQLQQRQVINKISITKQEIDTFLNNQLLQGAEKGEFNLGHIFIALPEGANAEQISKAKQKAEGIIEKLQNGADFAQTAIAESEGQQALEGGNLGWRSFDALPTLFSDWLRGKPVNSLSHAIRSPGGFHIIKLLGKRSNEEQHIVEQRHVRHILIATGDLTSSEARERLLKIRERIINGEDFSELAKLHSDDPGSGKKGGDLGWVSPGVMVPPFEETYVKLAVNEVSEPVKTQFGWHIIEVLGTRSLDNTDNVKRKKAQESIHARKTEPALQEWLRGLKDGSFIEIRL